MTGIIAFPLDAVSSAPLYSGEMLRNTLGVLATKASNRPIGAVSGVIPGAATSGLVSATSTTWTVNPFQSIQDLESSATAGPYYVSVSTVQTGTVNASNTYARIDLLSLTASDPAEGDGTSTPGFTITYTPGGSNGLAPATPARSFPFAQIGVPATGGGSPSVTWVGTFTVATGGITPVSGVSTLPANPVVGQAVYDLAAKSLKIWTGSSWQFGGAPGAILASALANNGVGWTTGGMTYSVIDSANLALPNITVPPSGSVALTFCAFVANGASSNSAFAWSIGTANNTNMVGQSAYCPNIGTGIWVNHESRVTGLTPGATVSFYLQGAVPTGPNGAQIYAGSTIGGGPGYGAYLEAAAL